MKIRKGFVTNSSSSSFIIAFKNEKDYQDFVFACEDCNYMQIKELIENQIKEDIKNNKTLEDIKKESILFLEHSMTYIKQKEWLKKKINYCEDFREELKQEKILQETEEFKSFKDSLINQPSIKEKVERINNAEKLIHSTIWDTSGGIMEFAIRNGLLEQEFFRWTVYVQHIG